MSDQFIGLYVFAGVGIAMMINSEYIRYLERQEEIERKDELLSKVTEQPKYNRYRSNSIGGFKKKTKKIKR